MEKVIYLLYKPDPAGIDNFSRDLQGQIAASLVAQAGVRKLRICIADSAVARAAALRLQNSPLLPQAIVSIWVDSAIFRDRWEGILCSCCSHIHGYLVTESEPLLNSKHPANDGERVYGMCQVALMQKPPRLSYPEWLGIWHDSHTQVAIATQSTFAYRQNVVARALTYAAPAYDAIVEENFPPEAMSSRHAFFAAEGDDERLQLNSEAMMESCRRFIDFNQIDVIPTSEYNIVGQLARSG